MSPRSRVATLEPHTLKEREPPQPSSDNKALHLAGVTSPETVCPRGYIPYSHMTYAGVNKDPYRYADSGVDRSILSDRGSVDQMLQHSFFASHFAWGGYPRPGLELKSSARVAEQIDPARP